MSLLFITIILFHRGKGKYVRGPGKKRVVNKAGWRSEISKKATSSGMAHLSMKTGRVIPEKKVM